MEIPYIYIDTHISYWISTGAKGKWIMGRNRFVDPPVRLTPC